MDAACACTHPMPLAETAILSLLCNPTHIVSHRYRSSDSACCTSCSQAPASMQGERHSTTGQRSVCLDEPVERPCHITMEACSRFSTAGGAFAQSAIRLKRRSITKTIGRHISFRLYEKKKKCASPVRAKRCRIQCDSDVQVQCHMQGARVIAAEDGLPSLCWCQCVLSS